MPIKVAVARRFATYKFVDPITVACAVDHFFVVLIPTVRATYLRVEISTYRSRGGRA